MTKLALLTVDELVECLIELRTDIRSEFIHQDYDENSCIDVRLRSFDDDWYLYHGSSDYDQDHRGYWGASMVAANDTKEDLRICAVFLINEVKNHASQ